MSNRPSSRKGPRSMPTEDRRAPADAKGTTTSLRQIKGMLGRPLGLERRGGALHVVLVDRRRAAPVDLAMLHLRDELRVRLLAHELDHAGQVLRHLGFVHDELGRSGWRGIEALPSPLLGKALSQAELLASDEPSPALVTITERLRAMHVAARLREEQAPPKDEPVLGGTVEVSDASHEEFESMERGWVSTMSPALPSDEPAN